MSTFKITYYTLDERTAYVEGDSHAEVMERAQKGAYYFGLHQIAGVEEAHPEEAAAHHRRQGGRDGAPAPRTERFA